MKYYEEMDEVEEGDNNRLRFLFNNTGKPHILGFADSTAAAYWLETLIHSHGTNEHVQEFLLELAHKLDLLPVRTTPAGKVFIQTQAHK